MISANRVELSIAQKLLLVSLLALSLVAIALTWVGVPIEFPIAADQIEEDEAYRGVFVYRLRWYRWPLRVAGDAASVLGRYTLYEDDARLAPRHSSVSAVAKHGAGHHTLWGDRLFFSASNNSDPRSNGRSYVLVTRAYLPPLVTALTVTALLFTFLYYNFQKLTDDHPESRRRTRVARASMLLCVVFIDFVILLACAFPLDATVDISPRRVSPESGHAFQVDKAYDLPLIHRLIAEPAGLVRLERTVFEDRKQLRQHNAVPQFIRDTGGGAHRFIDHRLLFSSSDNVDPRANGRTYAVGVRSQLTPIALLILGASPIVFVLYPMPSRLAGTRAIDVLTSYLELVIVAMAGWIIALELVNYARLPSGWLTYLAPALLVPILAVAGPRWMRTIRVMRGASARDWCLLSGVVLTCCLLVALMLLTSRPDPDDVGYLFEPLIDAASPGEPLSWRTWYNPVPGADQQAAVTWLSKYPAYDALAAFAGQISGVHPLTLYHNVFPVVGIVTWLVVYVLLLGQLGVRGPWLWPALASMTLMLLFDAATHRSFGNMWLLRIWQGKVLLWAVLVPIVSLLTLRLFAEPNRRTVTMLFLVLVCAPFVNRSALVLLPGSVIAMAVAYTLVCRGAAAAHTYYSFMRVAPVLLSFLLLAAAVAAWALFGGADAGADSESLLSRWRATSPPERLTRSTTALDTMRLAILPSAMLVVRDLTFLLILPVLALSGRVRWLLPVFSLCLILLFLMPPLAIVWHDLMSNLGYWRLYYSLPLPLGFALLPLCLPQHLPARWSDYGRLVIVAAVVWVVVQAYVRPLISMENRVSFKQPAQYRFPTVVREFVADAAPLLVQRQSVLAPTEVASMVGLVYPGQVRLSYMRAEQTSEAAILADQLLRYCHVYKDTVDAVEHYILSGAELIVMRECEPAVLAHFEKGLNGLVLEEIFRGHGYLIYSVGNSTRPEPDPSRPDRGLGGQVHGVK